MAAIIRRPLTALPLATAAAFALSFPVVAAPIEHDVIIRGGLVVDGSGSPGFVGDVILDKDRVTGIAHGHSPETGTKEVDARGLVVAPGFINMLSWAPDTLIADARGMSDLLQGVTLEVMGEGNSMGPLTDAMKREEISQQSDIRYPIQWTTLGEYLDHMEHVGISPNIASFVGAETVRVHELGEDDVTPTPDQLQSMRSLVHQAMQEGALGVASALIYAPGTFARTPELTALASEAAKCGGMYISHLRSEGTDLIPAIDELITISRDSGAPAEIYHFKQAGRENWSKLDEAIAHVDQARKAGLRITADMYTYTAGATGLDAAMPTWVQAGGYEKWRERLMDPAIRARVVAEMKVPGKGWESLYQLAGGADNVLLIGFKNPALKQYTGKSLAEVAKIRGKGPEETAIDLVIEDGTRVSTAYFLMDEKNLRREVGLPWMSFGSDEGAPAAEGVFLRSNNHPRAYGNFARLLGHYVRDDHATTLESAIRRLSSYPAQNLGLRDRGALKPGYYADVVLFDPRTIAAHATYAQPAQYATGVRDVFVNGVQVVRDGVHTGAKPGRVVRGPGWTGWPNGGVCR